MIEKNGFGKMTGYDIGGITENKPIYLDCEQITAIVRTYSDEKLEEAQKTEKNRRITETKTKCPFCEGENENARIFADGKTKPIYRKEAGDGE